MFRKDKISEGVRLFQDQFYPQFESLAKGALIMCNKHGKLKAVFYYDSMEHVKLVDQSVGRLETPVIDGVFQSLRSVVCAPLIRENLETTEFAMGNVGDVSAAQVRPSTDTVHALTNCVQVISSMLSHGEKGAAFTSFDNFIDQTFASMRPTWCVRTRHT